MESVFNSLGLHFSQSSNWPLFLGFVALFSLIRQAAVIRKKIIAALQFDAETAQRSFPLPKFRRAKLATFIIGVFFVGLAMLGPQWGQKAQTVKAEGLDVCFALDLSRSMLSEDVSPSRLGQAKNQLAIFIPRLGGDRAALVGFAGSGFVATPLSSDHQAILGFLEPLSPEFISNPSTDLSAGIDSCLQALQLDKTQDSGELLDSAAKLIVLISDGEEDSDTSSSAVEKAVKLGVPIYGMAVGTAKGSPIALRDERGILTGYLKDPATNQPVNSKLEEKNLKEIARKTGGKLFYTSGGIVVWKQFEESISNYKRDSRDAGTKLDREERFQWPLLIGFLILLLEFLVPELGFRKGADAKGASSIVALLVFWIFGFSSMTYSPKAFASSNDPRAVYLNNRGISKLAKKDKAGGQRDLDEALTRDASDAELRFNWATAKMLSAQNDEGKISEQTLKDAIKEFDQLQQESANRAKAKIPSDDTSKLFDKKLSYQNGVANELAKDPIKALAHYYDGLLQNLPNSSDIDSKLRENIGRLLVEQQKQNQKGDGEDGKGKDPSEGEKDDQKEPPKAGEEANQKKQKAKFTGTEISETQARQILESVSGEEREVQKRKAQAESKAEGARQMKKGERGSGSTGKPW